MFGNPHDLMGRVIAGYRVERLISTGATGAVFLGQATTASQVQVAIKILVVPWNTSPEDRANFQARFRREAQTLQRLQHPYILPLLAFGEEAGLLYMVLPYMAGGTLATRLARQGGPLPLPEVVAYLIQVAAALDEAHRQQIIHRDIKPANILLDAQGRPYLADFSIVGFTDLGHTTLTATGQVLGTPAYLAPEQARGGAVGPGADIYSLGVVIYELVTGRLPFPAASLPEFIQKHAQETPPSLRLLRPDLPEPAEAVLLQALAKRPEERFGSAGVFAQAFALGVQGQWVQDVRRPAVPAAPPGALSAGPFTSAPTVVTPPPTTTPQAPSASGGLAAGSSAPGTPGQFPASGSAVGAPVYQGAGAPPGSSPAWQPWAPPPPGGQWGVPAAPPPAPKKRRTTLIVLPLLLIIVVVGSLGVLGANHQGPLASFFSTTGVSQTATTTIRFTATTGVSSSTPRPGQGCTKVGVLLPESNTSPRWEAYDHPLLVQQLEAAGFSANNIDYSNANGDTTTQQTQAEADLTRGDCILIVAPHDSAAAAAIVTEAGQQNVPVIAYDRFIFSDDLNYYVSFNGVTVGKLQGQYIADHYMDPQYGVSAGHNNIAFIDGSPTDNNATLFANGAHDILDPLITAGTLNKVYEQFTPNWDPPTGETEMEAALTANNNNIQLVLTANDDLGGAAIQALAAQGLAGKVLVTGQDATVPGLQRILEGTQAMTVYKPIIIEATAAAQLAAAISKGTGVSTLTNGATFKNPMGNASIPSVLVTPEAVDKTNIDSTVIADGFVTKVQLCTGLPAGTDTGGICS